MRVRDDGDENRHGAAEYVDQRMSDDEFDNLYSTPRI